jgi:hypothetical protein
MSAHVLTPVFDHLFVASLSSRVEWRSALASGTLAVISISIAGYWLVINQQKEVTYKDILIIAAGFSIVKTIPQGISFIITMSSAANYPGRFLLLSNIYTAIILFIFGFMGGFVTQMVSNWLKGKVIAS